MALAPRNPGLILPFETESTVTDGLVVVVGSADSKVALPGGADPTSGVVGIVYLPDGSSRSSGETVDVVVSGIYPAVASAGITRGANVAVTGTSGKVKTAAPAAGVNTMLVGTALETCTTDGDRVAVLLRPHMMQGA